MDATKLAPLYDYLFIDEGQDFPLSFIRLCHAIAREGKFVLAYDDLQTIFQAKTPSTADIFGADPGGRPYVSFEEDIVLHKCYRNPNEVLISAHALGFGIYGDRIVQMLESPEHWEDIGYVVKKGTFVEGSETEVERPQENSVSIISDNSKFEEIVRATSYGSIEQEIEGVTTSIKSDLADGLQPEDVLVVTVDDKFAKRYLKDFDEALSEQGIASNNLHSDAFGIRDFSKEGRVTLSTVHKAKGNEAFMVYVVGVDSIMAWADVRRRNMLFTAMTRAKGWVRVSGVGNDAERCAVELAKAREAFPRLKFKYPGPDELKVMRRDLEDTADKKLKARRLIEQLRDLSEEEIEELMKEIRQRETGEGRKSPKRGDR
jgi:superfamily I DNA and RNA helicase